VQLWKGFWGFRWRLRPTVHGVLVVGAVALPLLLTYLPDDQKWLSALLTAVAAVGGGLATNVIEKWRRRSSLSMQGDARRCYLRGLRRECQLLPLAALGGDEGLDETLTLEQVYIALDTTMVPADSKTGEVVDRTSREDVFVRSSHRETVPLSARAALATSPWLAILGDPGGGKSTFVRRILNSIKLGSNCLPYQAFTY